MSWSPTKLRGSGVLVGGEVDTPSMDRSGAAEVRESPSRITIERMPSKDSLSMSVPIITFADALEDSIVSFLQSHLHPTSIPLVFV